MTEYNSRLFADFLYESRITGYREQYLRGLRSRVPRFFSYLAERELSLQETGVAEAQEYQGWLIESGRVRGGAYSNRTILSFLGAASAFCNYIKRKGLIPENPFKAIRKVRAEKRLPKGLLKEKELDTCLQELSHFEKEPDLKSRITRYKVHIIAELMYATGLRISEVAGLHVEDIDFLRGVVTVQDGKGGASRIAYLNDYAKDLLRLYVKQLRPLVFSDWNRRNGSLLFGTGAGWLIKLVNKTLQEVSGGQLTSHSFRHALGYHLLRAGCGIRHIQQILGHKRLRNTEIYTKVDREDLKEVLDSHHPRQWKGIHAGA